MIDHMIQKKDWNLQSSGRTVLINSSWLCCVCSPSAFSKEQEKEKNLEEEHSAPQSAFLGPTLWDKTLPYDGDAFQLEYMDLEEFLSENGIPSSPSHHLHRHHDQHKPQATSRHQPITPPAAPTLKPSVMDLSSHASINTSATPPNCLHSSPARAGNKHATSPHLVPPFLNDFTTSRKGNNCRFKHIHFSGQETVSLNMLLGFTIIV